MQVANNATGKLLAAGTMKLEEIMKQRREYYSHHGNIVAIRFNFKLDHADGAGQWGNFKASLDISPFMRYMRHYPPKAGDSPREGPEFTHGKGGGASCMHEGPVSVLRS
eukprot:GHVU01176188.1.p2 GENE.GHVU01176188.1~~GHVU01176188.1.p2  ORF type:complete len:109 (+),score=16.30 GHVU01176188.1:191-517(+)